MAAEFEVFFIWQPDIAVDVVVRLYVYGVVTDNGIVKQGREVHIRHRQMCVNCGAVYGVGSTTGVVGHDGGENAIREVFSACLIPIISIY